MATANVWFFYPNLIGYVRIILVLIGSHAMMNHPFRAMFCYILSELLDAADGYVARLYKQCSRFGAILDQLTDRCTTLSLVLVLIHFYPSCTFLYQLSAIIDIASHWLHLHAADLTGKTTHKASANPILNLYYTSREFLFLMCFGNEAFYCLMYVNHFWSGPGIFGLHFVPFLALLSFPFAIVKSGISLVHLVTAAQSVVHFDRMLTAKDH